MLTREELEQSWARTRQLLSEAVAFVPSSDYKMLEQYLDYLDHNELGLALEELLAIGEEKGYTADFFKPLVQAATNIGLDKRPSEIASLIRARK